MKLRHIINSYNSSNVLREFVQELIVFDENCETIITGYGTLGRFLNATIPAPNKTVLVFLLYIKRTIFLNFKSLLN